MARRFAALLLTDIVGSTPLWAAYPDRMSEVVAEHDRALARSVLANGGYVLKSTGDGGIGVFAAPSDALASGVDLQRSLDALAIDPQLPVEVRALVHCGELEERDGDLFGVALNLASRLLGVGGGREVLVSSAAAELVSGSLPPPRKLRDLGLHMLRGFAEPARVFAVDSPELPRASERSRPSLVQFLPEPVTTLIGRESELAQLAVLLAAHRLVTVTGVGGTGKTRLALRAANEWKGATTGRVWLVELAGVTDAELVTASAAAAVGAPAGTDSLVEDLVERLNEGEALLVLDNCEHLLAEVAAFVGNLLPRCPSLRILATSRELLGVTGELALPVPSLALPPNDHPSAVAASEAVQLLVDRVAAARPGFRVDETNADAFGSICRRLDGIPLALELAAARMRTMSVRDVAERLEDRFGFLSRGSRGGIERHQTLRAVVDWSYRLLDATDAEVFRRVAVFAGGFGIDGAQQVVAAKGEMADILAALTEKSLIELGEDPGGRTRYRMLETLRQYAWERLEESGEAAEVSNRHAAYYLQVTERAYEARRSPGGAEAASIVLQERENLIAAADWLLQRGGDEAGRMIEAMSYFWRLAGWMLEQVEWLRRGLEVDESSLDRRARLLADLASSLSTLGHPREARGLIEEALDLAQQSSDPFTIDIVTVDLAMLCRSEGDLEGWQEHVREALARAEGREEGLRRTLIGSLGDHALMKGDAESALLHYLPVLEEAESVSDLRHVASVSDGMAMALLQLGRANEAKSLAEKGLRAAQRCRDTLHAGLHTHNLGVIELRLGSSDQALRLARSALEGFLDSHQRDSVAPCIDLIAAIAARRGDAARAATLFGAAAALRLRLGEGPWRWHYDAEVEVAWQALGEAEWTERQRAGTALTDDEIVQLALHE